MAPGKSPKDGSETDPQTRLATIRSDCSQAGGNQLIEAPLAEAGGSEDGKRDVAFFLDIAFDAQCSGAISRCPPHQFKLGG